jgi:hypothetical protein
MSFLQIVFGTPSFFTYLHNSNRRSIPLCCRPFPARMLAPRVIRPKGACVIPQCRRVWEWVPYRVKTHAKVGHKAMPMASRTLNVECYTMQHRLDLNFEIGRTYASVRANCSKRTRLPCPASLQNFTKASSTTARGSPRIWIFFPGLYLNDNSSQSQQIFHFICNFIRNWSILMKFHDNGKIFLKEPFASFFWCSILFRLSPQSHWKIYPEYVLAQIWLPRTRKTWRHSTPCPWGPTSREMAVDLWTLDRFSVGVCGYPRPSNGFVVAPSGRNLRNERTLVWEIWLW